MKPAEAAALLLAVLGLPGDAATAETALGEVGAPIDAVRDFQAKWEFAEVRIGVMESLACGLRTRTQEVAERRARLRRLVDRANAQLGRIDPLLLLLEPWHGEVPCDEYRVALQAADSALAEIEAMLAPPNAEAPQ